MNPKWLVCMYDISGVTVVERAHSLCTDASGV